MELLTFLHELIKEFQTLVAGVLAIAAALIAYRGAVRQASATVEAADANRREARRAVAAGLLGELTECGLALRVVSKRVERWHHGQGIPQLTTLDTGIFDSNAAAVGLLPADEAYAIAMVYKLIKNLEREFGEITSGNVDLENVTGPWLAERAGSVQAMIDLAVRGIQETAELDPAKFNPIKSALERQAQDFQHVEEAEASTPDKQCPRVSSAGNS